MTHKIIMQQLGGNKFIAMTGSHNFTYSETDNNRLSMHLRKNNLKAQYLTIRLNSLDLYDLTFTKKKKTYETIGGHKFCVKSELVTVAEITNIYEDMLQLIFEQQTGLRTSL